MIELCFCAAQTRVLRPASGAKMVEEILLRIVQPKFLQLQLKIADILRSDFKVTLIADTRPNKDVIDKARSCERVVCLSQDIVWPEDLLQSHVSLFKISRVFEENGTHAGWFIPSISGSMLSLDSSLLAKAGESAGSGCCVIDSDIATGATRKVAMRLFPGAEFYAPIVLQPHQDLLDVEDLVYERSLVWKGEQFFNVSYLFNSSFFRKRTSISESRYDQIAQLVRGSIGNSLN